MIEINSVYWKNIRDKTIQALILQEDLLYKGRLVINHIGTATYIDTEFLRNLMDRCLLEDIKEYL